MLIPILQNVKKPYFERAFLSPVTMTNLFGCKSLTNNRYAARRIFTVFLYIFRLPCLINDAMLY